MPVIYDPQKKLVLLKQYMELFIENMGKGYNYSFGRYLKDRYPHVFPHRPEYIKRIATHCYYCGCKLVRFNDKKAQFRPSIDHYYPQSKKYLYEGKVASIYVICCQRCNGVKKDFTPAQFTSFVTKLRINGKVINGYTQKETERFYKNLQAIHNDVAYGIKRKVYFVKEFRIVPPGYIYLREQKAPIG